MFWLPKVKFLRFSSKSDGKTKDGRIFTELLALMYRIASPSHNFIVTKTFASSGSRQIFENAYRCFSPSKASVARANSAIWVRSDIKMLKTPKNQSGSVERKENIQLMHSKSTEEKATDNVIRQNWFPFKSILRSGSQINRNYRFKESKQIPGNYLLKLVTQTRHRNVGNQTFKHWSPPFLTAGRYIISIH